MAPSRSSTTSRPASSRARTVRPRGRPARPAASPGPDTREAIFQAAAAAFSARGYDGVVVDEIARRAGVNKAMLYYHFRGKLGLYRAVVSDMLRGLAAAVGPIADAPDAPDTKMARFVGTFLEGIEARPWAPTLMLREIAEGAPHLDVATLKLLRDVFATFVRIVREGQRAGVFREVHPVLAYMSVLAPMLLNAARERAAAVPGRKALPMFASVSRDDLRHHLQRAANRVLAKD